MECEVWRLKNLFGAPNLGLGVRAVRRLLLEEFEEARIDLAEELAAGEFSQPASNWLCVVPDQVQSKQEVKQRCALEHAHLTQVPLDQLEVLLQQFLVAERHPVLAVGGFLFGVRCLCLCRVSGAVVGEKTFLYLIEQFVDWERLYHLEKLPQRKGRRFFAETAGFAFRDELERAFVVEGECD